MNDKQAAFVNEYIIDMNASAAARRAGYSPKTAGYIGHENLKKPKIREAIDAALVERAKRTEVTADMVLERIWHEANNANSDSARVRALELYGKHLGVTFTDTIKHEGEERIVINLTPTHDDA